MSFNSPSLSSSDSLSGLPPKILELLSKQAEAIALQSKVLLKQHQQLRFFVTWYGSIGGHKSTKSLSGKRFN